jgi:hypothetical protein
MESLARVLGCVSEQSRAERTGPVSHASSANRGSGGFASGAPLGADGTTIRDMLLILVVLGLAVFGLVRLAKPLEPGQRVVLVLVFVAAIVCLVLKLIQLGLLGRVSEQP